MHRRRCGRVPRAGVFLPSVGGSAGSHPQSGYLCGTRFMYTAHTMTTASPEIDLATLIADTEDEIVRLVRDRDPSTHGLVRDGPLPPGARRLRSIGWQAHATAARAARLRQHHRRAPARPAGRGGRGTRAQLLARPRRHRGRRRRASPSPHAVDDPRHPPGDQHRRHAVQPVADRAPSADRPRLPRRHGPAPDAPLRRDVPGPVRGPVHRHRQERCERDDDRSTCTST